MLNFSGICNCCHQPSFAVVLVLFFSFGHISARLSVKMPQLNKRCLMQHFCERRFLNYFVIFVVTKLKTVQRVCV